MNAKTYKNHQNAEYETTLHIQDFNRNGRPSRLPLSRYSIYLLFFNKFENFNFLIFRFPSMEKKQDNRSSDHQKSYNQSPYDNYFAQKLNDATMTRGNYCESVVTLPNNNSKSYQSETHSK